MSKAGIVLRGVGATISASRRLRLILTEFIIRRWALDVRSWAFEVGRLLFTYRIRNGIVNPAKAESAPQRLVYAVFFLALSVGALIRVKRVRLRFSLLAAGGGALVIQFIITDV
jgi:hypothetical protein